MLRVEVFHHLIYDGESDDFVVYDIVVVIFQ